MDMPVLEGMGDDGADTEGTEAPPTGGLGELLAMADKADLEELGAAAAAATEDPAVVDALAELEGPPSSEPGEAVEGEEGAEVAEVPPPEPLSAEEQAAADEEARLAEFAMKAAENAGVLETLKKHNIALQHQGIEAAGLPDPEVAEAAVDLVDDLLEQVQALVEEAEGLVEDSAKAAEDADEETLEATGTRLAEIATEAEALVAQAQAAVSPVERPAGEPAVADGGKTDLELWSEGMVS